MGKSSVQLLIALSAPSANSSPEDQKRAMLLQLGMIVFMVVIFWVLLLRPQQKKAKEQAELLKTLKTGDKVITSSGILGIITSVREDAIIIRSADTKLELQKGAVSQILERGA